MKPHERARTGNPLPVLWHYADEERRLRGAMLERFGFGPVTTASRIVGTWATARLRRYEASGAGPVLLMVPAPIKPAYIWDLAPPASAVRRCLAAGLRVYLIEWQRPQSEHADLGLADYAYRLIDHCLDAVAAETGEERAFVAGHSLGGTLAAIHASLRADRVAGLVALEAPIRFIAPIGRLESMVRSLPRGTLPSRQFAAVPGSILSAGGVWADPVAFEWEPWLDWLRSQQSPAAARRYWQVLRWILDELPMPRLLFEQIVERLYREDRFACRRLQVAGRLADPRALTMPILAVADPRSRVVPPDSVHACRDLAGTADIEVLEYRGDIGVMLQHVGVLIGEQAHRTLWPHILAWLLERAPAH